MRPLLALLALLYLLAKADPAAARPRTHRLLLFGAALAPPTYFLGVTLHEGSHAVFAKLFGARITKFRVLPWRDPDTGAFYWGYVSWNGTLTTGQYRATLLAPRITDMVLLSTYGALVLTGAVPNSRYGRMAMAVVASGIWVDFSKDVFAFQPQNDMIKVYVSLGYKTTASQIPLRLLHASLSIGAGYFLYRGYKGVFARDEAEPMPVLIPLLSGSF